ncbi:MAG: hypothetical protein ACI3XI_04750 [Eubacteriales bacterium]
MKKIICALLSLLMLFSLAACSGSTISHYSATMLVQNNINDSYSASWGTLSGTFVINMKKSSGAQEGEIHYTASLEEGELTVYYRMRGSDGERAELFSLKGGDNVDDRGGYVEMNDKIEIIIETNGKTKGGSIKIDFE